MLKKLKNYVSEVDKFLKKFNQEHQGQYTELQRKERNIHKRVKDLRDNPAATKKDKDIWEKF